MAKVSLFLVQVRLWVVVLLFALVGILSVGAVAHAADINGNLSCGANNLSIDTGNCVADNASADDIINNLITNIVNIFSVVVGIIAVIMIIIGGFRYITSGGDSGNVTSAKNTIMYAIIGLIIVALAQIIVRFVLSKSTSI